jgi:putative peptide zinc metalloprotease protein
MTTPSPGAILASRLSQVCVELRPELQVVRQVFRGEPSYVIQDPLSSQSQWISVEDYAILSRLREDRTLDEVFSSLVGSERLEEEDEERFYEFIFELHRISFLKLPIADEATLYSRHLRKKRENRPSLTTSLLFRRVSLWNPDAFLSRTQRVSHFLFNRVSYALWGLLVGTALWVWFQNRGEFRDSMGDLLSPQNVALMWVLLTFLKVLHEFGHAYACKRFGGHVPDMGLFFILFTPCAFVDASAAWGFPKKRHRMLVNLAGMYVELAIAAFAMLLWAVVEPGLLRSVLHNTVLLASIVTVGFNINPLMRFDGYYAMSDMLGVPNLRSRSQGYVIAVLKRFSLGVPVSDVWGSVSLRFTLFWYGISSSIYKVLLVLGVSLAIAIKFPTTGLLLAASYFGGEILRILKGLLPYLLTSDESRRCRPLAATYAAGVLTLPPLILAGVPIPTVSTAPGFLRAGRQEVLRAPVSGFLEEVHVEPGQQVEPGRLIARLSEPDKRATLRRAEANLDAVRIRERILEVESLNDALRERQRAAYHEQEIVSLREDFARLELHGAHGGQVVECLRANDIGSFVKRGDRVATLTQGSPTVQALMTQEDLADVNPREGMSVDFHLHATPLQTYTGIIRRITPVGSRQLPQDYLDHLDPAELGVDPVTGEAARTQFQVFIDLGADELPRIPHNASGTLRIKGEDQTLGQAIYRKVLLLGIRIGS